MDLRRYPVNSLVRHPGRTVGLVALVALLAAVAFGGTLVVSSLTRGLSSLEARMGADIICAPKEAKSTHDLQAVLVEGTPDSFYMDASVVERIAAVDGVERVSPQYYLATVKAGCCTMPIQIIGIDPETDFTIQPWIDHSLGHGLSHGEVVVGCNVTGAPGSQIMFYGRSCTIAGKLDETGTSMDNAAYCDVETVCDLIEGSREQGLAVLEDADPTSVVSTVQVKVADGANVDTVLGDINVHLRDVWAVSARQMTTGVADGMAGASRVVEVLMAILCVASAVVLAVAFVVLARQRTREFGILRVLGASSASVMRMVLVEGLVVSVVGALVGILVAGIVVLSFSSAIESALGLPYLMPGATSVALVALLVLVVSVLLSMAGSAVAASRLAKVDPAQVLREG